MAIDLRTVISELQFLLQLSNETPKDRKLKKRLKELVQNAKDDLAEATKGIGGDDPLIGS